jgi:periplasmic glucans biosynthesis protein
MHHESGGFAVERRKPPAAAALAATIFALLAVASGRAAAFGFDQVVERARTLAQSPYKKPDAELPDALRNLSYEQYRDIRYKPDRAVWHGTGLPYELEFFHPGRYFADPVKVNEITPDGVREIRFDPTAFDYGANKLDSSKWQGLGFAGFRVHFPINKPGYKDEVLSFLGASYFRALGRGQFYGSSARGLAIDTAITSGEEFPRFVEFWVERPAAGSKDLKIFALLDSPSATGAYRFLLHPGDDMVMEVRTRLYLRTGVAKIGLAPLTSMFYFGENQRSAREDYRPEVHDADGLSIQAPNGEWIWRPLVNPKRLLVTSFSISSPVGFGLMQRDRSFADYQELDARYEQRPSLWVEPKGSWGNGRVELVLIPTPDETNDNVVAYWIPDPPPQPREPYEYEYRLLWQGAGEKRPPTCWATQSRRGFGHSLADEQPAAAKERPSVVFTIDFEGPALKVDDAAVSANTWADTNGEIIETHVERNTVSGGVRLTLRVRRADEGKPVELRATLKAGNDSLSETWSYILPPD